MIAAPHRHQGRLRAELTGHRYLHLATHGYFAPPAIKSALAPVEADRAWRRLRG